MGLQVRKKFLSHGEQHENGQGNHLLGITNVARPVIGAFWSQCFYFCLGHQETKSWGFGVRPRFEFRLFYLLALCKVNEDNIITLPTSQDCWGESIHKESS